MRREPLFSQSACNILETSLISAVFSTDAESCVTQNITDWTGSFQSPTYPRPYTPDMDCYWLLHVSEGNLIEINFQDFAVGIFNIIYSHVIRVSDVTALIYLLLLQTLKIFSFSFAFRWTMFRYENIFSPSLN